jgi:signal transduction histidine kinase
LKINLVSTLFVSLIFSKVKKSVKLSVVKLIVSLSGIVLSNENHILKVEDTGCGIDTKNIFKIYDKYFQVDVANQGIGLGLSVVKEYCDKNNISIKIDADIGVGTTFYLNYEKLLG